MPEAEPGVAATFGTVADAYDAARPGYPRAALEAVVDRLGLGPGSTVIDLAAGTGKLTRALRAVLPCRVVPVEPSDGMRAAFRRASPDLLPVEGTAEAIPLPDGAADAVLVGQAFHWFRPEGALAEIARVLGGAGGLAVLYNRRDETVPWVARFGRLLHEVESTPEPASNDAWRSTFAPGGPFEPLREERFANPQPFGAERLLDLARSRSYVAALPAPERHRLLARVRSFAENDPDLGGRSAFAFPYVTELSWTRRR